MIIIKTLYRKVCKRASYPSASSYKKDLAFYSKLSRINGGMRLSSYNPKYNPIDQRAISKSNQRTSVSKLEGAELNL